MAIVASPDRFRDMAPRPTVNDGAPDAKQASVLARDLGSANADDSKKGGQINALRKAPSAVIGCRGSGHRWQHGQETGHRHGRKPRSWRLGNARSVRGR